MTIEQLLKLKGKVSSDSYSYKMISQHLFKKLFYAQLAKFNNKKLSDLTLAERSTKKELLEQIIKWTQSHLDK